jgi:hypothetical protein
MKKKIKKPPKFELLRLERIEFLFREIKPLKKEENKNNESDVFRFGSP